MTYTILKLTFFNFLFSIDFFNMIGFSYRSAIKGMFILFVKWLKFDGKKPFFSMSNACWFEHVSTRSLWQSDGEHKNKVLACMTSSRDNGPRQNVSTCFFFFYSASPSARAHPFEMVVCVHLRFVWRNCHHAAHAEIITSSGHLFTSRTTTTVDIYQGNTHVSNCFTYSCVSVSV